MLLSGATWMVVTLAVAGPAVRPSAAPADRLPQATTWSSAAGQSAPEDAACSAPAGAAPAERDIDCSEAPTPPPPPAVVDCNDPSASIWVAEMIGSCDMPRQSASGPSVAPSTPGSRSGNRLCYGTQCSSDSSPLRPVHRDADPMPRVTTVVDTLGRFDSASPLAAARVVRPAIPPLARPFRPPIGAR